MERTPTRRDFLLSGVGATISGVAGCSGLEEDARRETATTRTSTSTESTAGTPTDTPGEEWNVNPLEHDKLIGAHYYAWYWGEGGYGVHRRWPWLEHSPYTPELGQYDSRDEDVVNQHIKWAVENGINWFIITAGSPTSRLNRNIQETFMNAELTEEINWNIQTGFDHFPIKNENGRTDMDSAVNRSNLRVWFEHFEDDFFHDPNYLQINGRPVLHDFSTPLLAGDIEGAFEEAEDAIDTDPYIVANPTSFWGPPVTEPPTAYDAINKYAFLQSDADYSGFPEEVGRKSREWLFRSEYHDMDFVPTIMPGFNDQEIEWVGRKKHPIMDLSPEQFREVCREALSYVDPEIEALVITSFNEFPEGSTIEPTEEYGHKRLDIVKEELAMKESDPLQVNDYSLMELDFNRTFKPSEIKEESSSKRDLAFMAGRMEFFSEDNSLSYEIGVSGAEPVFVHGVYGQEESEDHSPTSWRWLGGPDALTALYADPEILDATEAVIYGRPIVENEIEANVYFNGQQTDYITFGERAPQTYSLSLTE